MTSTGCLGDSGLYASGSYLISSSDETLARICQTAESYDTAIRSGKILRVPLAKTISRGEYFQGMSYAVDNTQLQPPYFPMGRNADGASALLYLLSDSQSWIGHLPWAIYHQSDADRKSYLVEHTEQYSRIRLSDILIYALKSSAPPIPTTRSRALVSMGEQLVALGELPGDAFEGYVRAEFVRSQTDMLKFMEEKLSSGAGKYPWWEKDMRTMSANIRISSRRKTASFHLTWKRKLARLPHWSLQNEWRAGLRPVVMWLGRTGRRVSHHDVASQMKHRRFKPVRSQEPLGPGKTRAWRVVWE